MHQSTFLSFDATHLLCRILCSLFADVMREVGTPSPVPLPVAERQEIERAGAARRRNRAAVMTGAAAPCTAPLQVLTVRP